MNQVDRIYSENKTPQAFAKSYLGYVSELMCSLDSGSVAQFIELLIQARKDDRQIFFIGNGGSAATASHFANDLGVGLREYQKPFRVISLTDNVAAITAVGNDDGYDEIFKKQLQILMKPQDVLIAISASGNSPNLLKAIEYAKGEKQAKTFGIVGFDGGKMLQICDGAIHVKTAKGEYGPVEDLHMVIDHLTGNYLYRFLRDQ